MSVSERLQVPPEVDPGSPTADAGLSLLFPGREREAADAPQPACFRDLYLDQVLDALLGRDEFRLRPLFHQPLRERTAVDYRRAVSVDLESDALREAVDEFTEGMRTVRAYLTLAEKQRHPPEKGRWLLDAALRYCELVGAFDRALAELEPASDGLRLLARYLAGHRASDGFMSLESDAQAVHEALASVRYAVRIKGTRVTVQGYAGERDLSAEVAQTFARFRESDAESHLVKVPDSGTMDHIEAQIAERVRRLFPRPFEMLEVFCAGHDGFVDPLLSRVVRELRFYTSYHDHLARLPDVPRAYPVLVDDWSGTSIDGGVDVALASKPGVDRSRLVPNDLAFGDGERVAIVTGPNQGGKTTFSRMVGQIHYLAALGLPVSARTARLMLCDGVFTLFSRPEDVSTLRGRLDQELFDAKQALDRAGRRTLILLNEVFASTTLADAVYLGERLIGHLDEIGCAAVWVTFLDELAGLDESTVSLVAAVDPADPTVRTFQIVRKPADGRAYASAIAEKYGISYKQLQRGLSR